MGKSERDKGGRGERWLRDRLRDIGFRAWRGRQYRGGPDSPDTVTPDLPIQWEMKWGYDRMSIKAVLAKLAGETAEGDMGIGVWKPIRKRAMMFMYLDDFLTILGEAFSEHSRIQDDQADPESQG